jgi:hypothetical protein
VNTDNEGVKRAERATASIVTEYPFPATINALHTLLALAYLQGAMDELQHVVDESDQAKERTLRNLRTLRMVEGGDAA